MKKRGDYLGSEQLLYSSWAFLIFGTKQLNYCHTNLHKNKLENSHIRIVGVFYTHVIICNNLLKACGVCKGWNLTNPPDGVAHQTNWHPGGPYHPHKFWEIFYPWQVNWFDKSGHARSRSNIGSSYRIFILGLKLFRYDIVWCDWNPLRHFLTKSRHFDDKQLLNCYYQ